MPEGRSHRSKSWIQNFENVFSFLRCRYWCYCSSIWIWKLFHHCVSVKIFPVCHYISMRVGVCACCGKSQWKYESYSFYATWVLFSRYSSFPSCPWMRISLGFLMNAWCAHVTIHCHVYVGDDGLQNWISTIWLLFLCFAKSEAGLLVNVYKNQCV